MGEIVTHVSVQVRRPNTHARETKSLSHSTTDTQRHEYTRQLKQNIEDILTKPQLDRAQQECLQRRKKLSRSYP